MLNACVETMNKNQSIHWPLAAAINLYNLNKKKYDEIYYKKEGIDSKEYDKYNIILVKYQWD